MWLPHNYDFFKSYSFRFQTKDNKENLYSYDIGICVNADPQKKFGENVGVVLKDKYHRHWIIGYYNNSQFIEGSMLY